ncbi:hypothetical protein Nepgr_019544 [Nepenthes gracilis]|uniref:Uncharacterized protein n=1 Tax=Nepenthes gracilis TaxID=150966 RepID=A0AAD3STN4_NEPGR|nr:hypothetical protein Nepgr_019544 [Nepenthes gracilis]
MKLSKLLTDTLEEFEALVFPMHAKIHEPEEEDVRNSGGILSESSAIEEAPAHERRAEEDSTVGQMLSHFFLVEARTFLCQALEDNEKGVALDSTMRNDLNFSDCLLPLV